LGYHPGEANLRAAQVVIINKVDTADYANVLKVRANVHAVNPEAQVIEAASPLSVEHAEAIRGKRVLVVEDGPTLTHGEMAYGAGVVAAQRFGAAALIDPRPFAVGSIVETFAKYPTTGKVLPAMGYGAQQTAELEATINASNADLVLTATPIDLRRVVNVKLPMERVRYELQVIGAPGLADVLSERLATQVKG
jgi:predicted GTPase